MQVVGPPQGNRCFVRGSVQLAGVTTQSEATDAFPGSATKGMPDGNQYQSFSDGREAQRPVKNRRRSGRERPDVQSKANGNDGEGQRGSISRSSSSASGSGYVEDPLAEALQDPNIGQVTMSFRKLDTISSTHLYSICGCGMLSATSL